MTTVALRRPFRHVCVGLLVLALAGTVSAGVPAGPVDRTGRYGSKAPSGNRRGRPRKFSRPARAITLTLPEDVVAALREIDADVSRAVVRAVQPLIGEPRRSPAELATFGKRAVIIVPPSSALKARAGVEFVPLPDGRALISFEEGVSVPEIELRLLDALADPTLEASDRPTFEALASILRSARQTEGMSVRRRSIIVLWLNGRQPAADSSNLPA